MAERSYEFTNEELEVLASLRKATEVYQCLKGPPPGERELFLGHVRDLQGLVSLRAVRRNGGDWGL